MPQCFGGRLRSGAFRCLKAAFVPRKQPWSESGAAERRTEPERDVGCQRSLSGLTWSSLGSMGVPPSPEDPKAACLLSAWTKKLEARSFFFHGSAVEPWTPPSRALVRLCPRKTRICSLTWMWTGMRAGRWSCSRCCFAVCFGELEAFISG